MCLIPGEVQTEKISPSRLGSWICILAAGLFSISGNSLRSQTLDVGLYGGGSYYLGDLNPGVHFMNYSLAYGILARYNIDGRWAVKISAYKGTVKGNSEQSKYMPERNLAFSSPVTDISAVAEFNFFDFYIGSRKNWISPYIYAGFSFFTFNPENGGVKLQEKKTEGVPYNTYSFSIPFGLGVKISLARRLGLALFWEMHKTFTDYLDDVSTTYPLNPDKFSDPTGKYAGGMQRGNSRNNDWYSFSGVTLTYKFNLFARKRCKDLEH